jgi:alkaline phosphatase
MKRKMLITTAILILSLFILGVIATIIRMKATILDPIVINEFVLIDKTPPPYNIIMLIGDGMGEEHIKMIEQFEDKVQDGYTFQQCPHTTITTLSATIGSPTDSAAAATALATGKKVNNGVISMNIPGDSVDLETLLEHYKKDGKSTGIITTTEITHATPAASNMK